MIINEAVSTCLAKELKIGDKFKHKDTPVEVIYIEKSDNDCLVHYNCLDRYGRKGQAWIPHKRKIVLLEWLRQYIQKLRESKLLRKVE